MDCYVFNYNKIYSFIGCIQNNSSFRYFKTQNVLFLVFKQKYKL